MLLGAFVLFTGLGLLIQWFVLPVLLPGLHAGHGLQAGGDWIGFHLDGVKLANALASGGWRAFELRPNGNFPVAESGILYYATGIREPWVLVPLDAALYASAITAIFNIFSRFAVRSVALIGLFPFVFLPGSIQFYFQVEKDVWAFTGSAWLLFVLTSLLRRRPLAFPQYCGLVALAFTAAGCAWLVRPYFSLVQLAVFGLGGVAVLLWICFAADRTRVGVRILCLLCCCGSIAFFAADVPGRLWPSSMANNPANLLDARRSMPPGLDCPAELGWLDRLVPRPVGRALQAIANLRSDQRAGTGYAGSNIDNSVCFSRPSDVIRYLPRALQVALFAPFPDMWFQRGVSAGARLMRLISGAEMLFAYAALPGILIAMWRARDRRYVLIVLAVILPIILLLATTIPNVGTLYRMRYGYLQILLGVGMIGWACLISEKLPLRTRQRSDENVRVSG